MFGAGLTLPFGDATFVYPVRTTAHDFSISYPKNDIIDGPGTVCKHKRRPGERGDPLGTTRPGISVPVSPQFARRSACSSFRPGRSTNPWGLGPSRRWPEKKSALARLPQGRLSFSMRRNHSAWSDHASFNDECSP